MLYQAAFDLLSRRSAKTELSGRERDLRAVLAPRPIATPISEEAYPALFGRLASLADVAAAISSEEMDGGPRRCWGRPTRTGTDRAKTGRAANYPSPHGALSRCHPGHPAFTRGERTLVRGPSVRGGIWTRTLLPEHQHLKLACLPNSTTRTRTAVLSPPDKVRGGPGGGIRPGRLLRHSRPGAQNGLCRDIMSPLPA